MDINTSYFKNLLQQAEAEQAQREADRRAEEAPEAPGEQGEQIVWLNIDLLDDFPPEKNKFRPATPERLEALKSSIQESGILNALLVRKKPNCERYEILAGHNRRTVARLLGWDTVPCIIKSPETEDEALVILNADNLNQREGLLPSERGWAYRQIMDVQGKRQGQRTDLTSGHGVPKSDSNRTVAKIGKAWNDSYKKVQRYILLTYLIPPLLDKADVNALGITAGVQLSYLSTEAQQAVYTYFFMDNPKAKITKNLTAKFREIDSNPDLLLDYATIERLVQEEKQDRSFRKVTVEMKDIRKHFHPGATQQEVMDTILLALDRYFSVAQEPASNSTFEGGETDV